MKRRFAAIVIVMAIMSGITSHAHEVTTHQNLGDFAVLCLTIVGCLPDKPVDRPMLPSLVSELEWGAVHEDDYLLRNVPVVIPLSGPSNIVGNLALGRFLFHFLAPFNASPALDRTLTFLLPPVPFPVTIAVQAKCSSLDWGLHSGACTQAYNTVLGPVSTTQTNQFSWARTQISDPGGHPTQGDVLALGYVIHLLEDLGSPPHTRNDGHPCLLGQYCAHYERANDGSTATVAALTKPLINTDTFTTPDEFFTHMATYTASNYYSENTAFEMPGPTEETEDLQYFYGNCITASMQFGTCENLPFFPNVRKIAAKGPLFFASCWSACDRTLATIDDVIAKEQFKEISPVIAQHVAAFIRFYAPSLTATTLNGGTVSVTNWENPVSKQSGMGDCIDQSKCSSLYVRGTLATLQAKDTPTAQFVHWSGDCSGTSKTLTLTLTGDRNCTAEFAPVCQTYIGNGAGFPLTMISNGSATITTTTSSGTSSFTVNFTQPVSFGSPQSVASGVLNVANLFQACGDVFPSGSGSRVDQGGIFHITTSGTAGGGVITLQEVGDNTAPANDGNCPQMCLTDTIHYVKTWQYDIKSGAYTVHYESNRFIVSFNAGTNTRIQSVSANSGTISGQQTVQIQQ